MLGYYESDRGSIELIHRSGLKVMLSNNYGDGTFKFYVFTSHKEMREHIAGRYEIKEERFWMDDCRGWAVAWHDCCKNYDNEDNVKFDKFANDPNKNLFLRVYSIGATFFFVVD